jgi:hypothetical protein
MATVKSSGATSPSKDECGRCPDSLSHPAEVHAEEGRDHHQWQEDRRDEGQPFARDHALLREHLAEERIEPGGGIGCAVVCRAGPPHQPRFGVRNDTGAELYPSARDSNSRTGPRRHRDSPRPGNQAVGGQQPRPSFRRPRPHPPPAVESPARRRGRRSRPPTTRQDPNGRRLHLPSAMKMTAPIRSPSTWTRGREPALLRRSGSQASPSAPRSVESGRRSPSCTASRTGSSRLDDADSPTRE